MQEGKMGRILLFKDLVRSLRVEPERGHLLLGERDNVGDERSGNLYDLVFHLADGPNVADYQKEVSLVIPVLDSCNFEEEALERISTIYQAHPVNETFCVNFVSPRFYRVVGQHGRAMNINEEKVKVIDRERFYGVASAEKRYNIERKIAELEEIEESGNKV